MREYYNLEDEICMVFIFNYAYKNDKLKKKHIKNVSLYNL